jgi:Uncharacterised conserved protein (DUF2368)
MGVSSSKEYTSRESSRSNFIQSVKDNVNDEIARRAMIQCEIQMAINIAKARDTICIFGTVWSIFATGVIAGHVVRKPIPIVANIPVVVGAVVLGNIADMAYGNKLNRVVKEAEYILDNERGRFVPMQQAPFFKLYNDYEKSTWYHSSTAVGDIFPNNVLWPRVHDKSSKDIKK